jgi:4-carboxymuconolactone decarboxylase
MADVVPGAGSATGPSNAPLVTERQSVARRAYGHVAPALAGLTDRVLLGEVWERPDLSKRDRGLIIVAAPVAGQRHTEPPGHARRALANHSPLKTNSS